MDRKAAGQDYDDLDFTSKPPDEAPPADDHGSMAEQVLRRAQAERGRDALAREVQAEAAVRAPARAAEDARRTAARKAARTEEARQRRRAAIASFRAAVGRAAQLFRTGRAWGTAVAQWAALFGGVALVAVHAVPFDGMIPGLEQAAAARFGQPVKIARVHLSLVPLPHWRLDGVVVGAERQLRVPRVKAFLDLEKLFADEPAYRTLALEAPILNEQALGWLLFGRPRGGGLSFRRIEATGARLDSPHIVLPAFDATAQIGADGGWRQAAFVSVDRNMSVELRPGDDKVVLAFRAGSFALPFGAGLTLEDFKAEGNASRDEVALTEFSARGYGGSLAGRARLAWADRWTLDGGVDATELAAERIVPRLAESGRIDGRALFAMQAGQARDLFAAPRVEGEFVVHKGALLGVDLGRLLQGDSLGGKTLFASLKGAFLREGGTTQLRQVELAAGVMSARGSASMDANRNLRGRFAVELAYRHVRARGNLAVSGTLDFPRFSR